MDTAIEAFASDLRGEVIRPEDPDYDQARNLYNGMVDQKPALIARPVDAGNVMTPVNLGRDSGLGIAIRLGDTTDQIPFSTRH
jgi:hypothetical protein